MLTAKINQARSFFSHWLNASDEHSLQAPFIYEFYTEVVKAKACSYSLEKVNQLRQSLFRDQSILEVTDYGAGSFRPNQRPVSDLARMSNQPRVSQLLNNISRKYNPAIILELGTSLGLSTLSMAMGAPNAQIITIEGCQEISGKASENFRTCGASNIELVNGDISKVLPQILSTLDFIDLLFIDANHNYQPTMNYFKQCLTLCKSQTIVVIDDIHWSPEMTRAWEEIIKQKQVRLSVDLFYAGVIFFRENLIKTHHVLHL